MPNPKAGRFLVIVLLGGIVSKIVVKKSLVEAARLRNKLAADVNKYEDEVIVWDLLRD